MATRASLRSRPLNPSRKLLVVSHEDEQYKEAVDYESKFHRSSGMTAIEEKEVHLQKSLADKNKVIPIPVIKYTLDYEQKTPADFSHKNSYVRYDGGTPFINDYDLDDEDISWYNSVCINSGMTENQLEKIILKLELKMCEKKDTVITEDIAKIIVNPNLQRFIPLVYPYWMKKRAGNRNRPLIRILRNPEPLIPNAKLQKKLVRKAPQKRYNSRQKLKKPSAARKTSSKSSKSKKSNSKRKNKRLESKRSRTNGKKVRKNGKKAKREHKSKAKKEVVSTVILTSYDLMTQIHKELLNARTILSTVKKREQTKLSLTKLHQSLFEDIVANYTSQNDYPSLCTYIDDESSEETEESIYPDGYYPAIIPSGKGFLVRKRVGRCGRVIFDRKSLDIIPPELSQNFAQNDGMDIEQKIEFSWNLPNHELFQSNPRKKRKTGRFSEEKIYCT
eukprot:TRINITY_DN7034_c0_g1_i3.p1 TRINITY_DN7034_c0_g1~~TRINITY_DN7034_c0_g1_i3.p1  ORF type:complete len:467 (-),score=92.16 TRINITY_DN7034_c0_g1_i3:36-1376(-)